MAPVATSTTVEFRARDPHHVARRVLTMCIVSLLHRSRRRALDARWTNTTTQSTDHVQGARMWSAHRWCDQCEILTPTQASAKPCLIEWSHASRSRMELSFRVVHFPPVLPHRLVSSARSGSIGCLPRRMHLRVSRCTPPDRTGRPDLRVLATHAQTELTYTTY